MKILVLCNHNPYVTSSASGNRFCGLIDGLCNEGNQITVGIVGGLHKKNEDVLFKSQQPNLRVVYLSKANFYNGFLRRMNTYFLGNIHQIFSQFKIKRLLEEQFDVVWLGYSDTVLSLFLKTRHFINAKTLIELNEFDDLHEVSGLTWLQRRKAVHEQTVFRESINRIDLFAVMTQTLLDYYSEMAKPEAKFIHLPMTVDISRFNKVSEVVGYTKPYIAFTGTMTNQKDGVDILIKAFAKVADKYPAYHLYLAGFWHYDVPMQEKLIAEYGLQNRIHYIGTLKREQIPPFVCNASVLALSRPDSHQAQGGFPTKLGEYLATGNPVCVTKVGEIPDYLEDNVSAFMAEPGDVDSFADALNRTLSDMVNAKRVGVNGKTVAEKNFDAIVQSNRLSNFLDNNL